MALMFRVTLDLGGICLQGPLSLSVSQLPSGVTNLMWWAFFVFYWAASCGTIIVLGWAASCSTIIVLGWATSYSTRPKYSE